jgi:valyl-tRNA synthetase
MKLPKVYEPGQYENNIYALWEKSGVFTADPSSKKKRFSISMPPPNETGTLSIGHALFLTLQDIMARHARLTGKDVLWLPGTDHAALPVNAIIEKKLADEGTNRHAIGREEFLRRTRQFVGNSRETMISQMRAMGASADWSRLRYTLDEALNRCVNETFTKMFEAGLIYRGHRIVNWDPNLETNISDDEVVYVEENAKFYTFQYGPFQIGTARPETKFGDKYVVMHPDDKRYAKYLHGDKLELEWINGPITATVIKDEAVDPNFGTGVMTITPWHSMADFEIAERHGLDKEQIINFDGKLLPIAGEFEGMSISEARPKIVEKLAAKGLLVKTDDNYVHNIAVNDRGKGVIEPQVRLQWFVDVNKPAVPWKGKNLSLKQVMQDVVKSGDIEIVPGRFEKVYFHWIDNLRDWCVSRQIWWGHRVPVWYREGGRGREEIYVGVLPPPEMQGWEQDQDTLDTWFSSALWTWSTLVDPELAKDYKLSLEELLQKSRDFRTYHPTTVMETGWDILFFWVARMILSTTFVIGQVPFKTVYLHGLVMAEDGKKMSKSRPESIIDPLDVTPKYGTDALRMALIMGVSPGNPQNWGWGKIEANRNFCNKLWNIARYVESKGGAKPAPDAKSDADHWILHELKLAASDIDKHIADLRFSEAYERLYHFVWDDFADWYIEASKTQENLPLLRYGLESVLKIAHPFAPFVTETIWQALKNEPESILAAASWPEIPDADKTRAQSFNELKTIVAEARTIMIAAGETKTTLTYTDSGVVEANAELIKQLARLENVAYGEEQGGVRLAQTKYDLRLSINRETYAAKLKERAKAEEATVKSLENRLKNKSYVKNAPAAIVDQTKIQLQEAKQRLEAINLQGKNLT